MFLVADTQLYKRLCPSVGRSVMVIELESVKTRPAHLSATGIGRVSGLVILTFTQFQFVLMEQRLTTCYFLIWFFFILIQFLNEIANEYTFPENNHIYSSWFSFWMFKWTPLKLTAGKSHINLLVISNNRWLATKNSCSCFSCTCKFLHLHHLKNHTSVTIRSTSWVTSKLVDIFWIYSS